MADCDAGDGDRLGAAGSGIRVGESVAAARKRVSVVQGSDRHDGRTGRGGAAVVRLDDIAGADRHGFFIDRAGGVARQNNRVICSTISVTDCGCVQVYRFVARSCVLVDVGNGCSRDGIASNQRNRKRGQVTGHSGINYAAVKGFADHRCSQSY